jgi:hypothetical protein
MSSNIAFVVLLGDDDDLLGLRVASLDDEVTAGVDAHRALPFDHPIAIRTATVA